MDLAEATRQALLILEEEQINPTVDYTFVSSDWRRQLENLNEALQSLHNPLLNIHAMRQLRPRPVTETPKLYVFRSRNFDLLRILYEQIHTDERPQFIGSILTLVRTGTTTNKVVSGARFPHFLNKTSCLPLVLEFCIRTNNGPVFFEFLQPMKHVHTGVAIMLMQLEETIALNYDHFSQVELEKIPEMLENLHRVAESLTLKTIEAAGKQVPNPRYRVSLHKLGNAIVNSIYGIAEECRKAVYYYIRDELQKRPNLEVESDKKTVEDYLTRLGFGPDLVGALNAAENEYKSATNQFELKNSLNHLRSFLEHLHRQAAQSIAAAAGELAGDKWGAATIYLRQKGLYTQQHEDFATSVYRLVSDKGIHPLGAPPEYARLLRNVVIEYGVMFLSVLDQRGVRITNPAP